VVLLLTQGRMTNQTAGAAHGSSPPRASLTELELAFSENPSSSDAYIALCEAYLEQDRLMEAMVVCKKGLKAHPEAKEGRVLLARVFAAQRKFPKAEKELQEILDLDPVYAPALYLRACWLLDSGDNEKGIAALKKAVDADGHHRLAVLRLRDLGIQYPPPASPGVPMLGQGFGPASGLAGSSTVPLSGADSGMPSSSLSALPITGGYRRAPQRLEGEDELEALAEAVAREAPKRGRARITAAILVLAFGSVAAVGVQQFLRKQKIETIAKLNREAFEWFNRDTYESYKKAASLYRKILDDVDDSYGPALGKLANTETILFGEHGDQEAEVELPKIFERGRALGVDNPDLRAAIALYALYSAQERSVAAEKARAELGPYVKAREEAGEVPSQAAIALAILEFELGEYDAATVRLANFRQIYVENVRAMIWHGRAAFRAGRLGVGLKAFQSAVKAHEGHPTGSVGAALIRLAQGDQPGATKDLDAYQAYVAKRPKDVSPRDAAQAEYARSEIYRSRGEDAKAEVAYEQAVRLDPTNADFPFGLGRFLLSQERISEAVVPLEKAIKSDPKRPAFLVELAEAKMHLGQFAEADQLLKKAEALAPTYLPAALARSRLMRRQKSPPDEESEAFAKSILTKWPGAVAEAKLELGRIYRAQRRLDEAKGALEASVEAMETKPPLVQSDILLSYGNLMADLGENSVALNSFRQAAELGEVEAWYRIAKLLYRGNGEDAQVAKGACQKYLEAGRKLRYSDNAIKICERLD
jgi:cellulose synthase operon protein C